jgi:hypothetical protein
MYSCLYDDCLDIIERHNKRIAALSCSSADADGLVDPNGLQALSKINPRNVRLLSSSRKMIEQMADAYQAAAANASTNANPASPGGAGTGAATAMSPRTSSMSAGAHETMLQTLVHLNEDELRSIVRIAIRRQVEVEIYIGCSGRLHYVLQKAFSKSDMKMWETLSMVAHEPQSFFGIPLQHISPSSWGPIVEQMRELRVKTLPIDRIAGLLHVAKEIPNLYQAEHPEAEKPLGADDILPIFVYVIVKAQVPSLLALNQEMQSLCDPDNKLSETGYYLATLEASLQHLLDTDVTGQSLMEGRESLFPANMGPGPGGIPRKYSGGEDSSPR